MRIFIAIDFESQVIEKIKKEFNMKGINIAKGNHLTFKFLGEITERDTGWVKEKLKEVDFRKFRVSLSKLGVFPNERRINVIWVGLEPERELKELHDKIDSVLKNKFAKDNRFQAHITIGRVKFVDNKMTLRNKLKETKFEKEALEVNEFKLIQSNLKPEGPEYIDLEVYKAEE